MKDPLVELAEGKPLDPESEALLMKELAEAYDQVEQTKLSDKHKAIVARIGESLSELES